MHKALILALVQNTGMRDMRFIKEKKVHTQIIIPAIFIIQTLLIQQRLLRVHKDFPGFSPSDVVDANRSNIGVYADAELNVTKEWLLDGAIRFENYSDFGSVATFKLATRYKLASNFNVRGSVSTGYRAPSLQQINFSNTLTSFSGGQLVQSRIASNKDPITRAAGIPELKEETSVNTSLGL